MGFPLMLSILYNSTHAHPWYCVTYVGTRQECNQGFPNGGWMMENGMYWQKPHCVNLQESVCFTTKEDALRFINQEERSEDWLVGLGECNKVKLSREVTGKKEVEKKIRIFEDKIEWVEPSK